MNESKACILSSEACVRVGFDFVRYNTAYIVVAKGYPRGLTNNPEQEPAYEMHLNFPSLIKIPFFILIVSICIHIRHTVQTFGLGQKVSLGVLLPPPCWCFVLTLTAMQCNGSSTFFWTRRVANPPSQITSQRPQNKQSICKQG